MIVEVKLLHYDPVPILVEVWDFNRLEERIESAVKLWKKEMYGTTDISDVSWNVLKKLTIEENE